MKSRTARNSNRSRAKGEALDGSIARSVPNEDLVCRYAAAREALQRALTTLQRREDQIALLEGQLRDRLEDVERLTQELTHTTSRLEDAHFSSVRLFDAYCRSLPGKLLGGRFEILHRIGSGGYGVVYQALDRRTHRDVALKLLRSAEGGYPASSSSEIYQLAHPNIATVLESGIAAEGIPFVAMELLRGRNLAEVIAQWSALSVSQAARLAYEVCLGLAEAHRWDVVHRDIKPANIFLAKQRSGPTVKILDFGLARVVRAPEVDGDRIAGTPEYVAPERLERKPYDWRVDVYAVGLLVYEMFGVALPPNKPGARIASWRIAPPALRELRPEVPEEISHLVARAVRRNPAVRPTAQEMAAVFAHHAASPSRLAELLSSKPVRVAAAEDLTLESVEHQSIGGADTLPLDSTAERGDVPSIPDGI